MAGYLCSFGGTGATTLSVVPATNQIRVVKVDAISASGTVNGAVSAFKYPSSTLSGGSAVAVTRMRDGAAAPTTTAKSGATPSGTAQTLSAVDVGPLASGALSFAFDVLLQPGSILHLLISNATAVVSFDELHLARST